MLRCSISIALCRRWLRWMIGKLGVVETRYFGGMTVEETADALNVSTDTVKRDWRVAKLWLLQELDGSGR